VVLRQREARSGCGWSWRPSASWFAPAGAVAFAMIDKPVLVVVVAVLAVIAIVDIGVVLRRQRSEH
jgi:hypothetical protein